MVIASDIIERWKASA